MNTDNDHKSCELRVSCFIFIWRLTKVYQRHSFCHGPSGGSRVALCFLCFSPVCLPLSILLSPASVDLRLDLWAWQQCHSGGAPAVHLPDVNPLMSTLRRQIVPPVTVTESRASNHCVSISGFLRNRISYVPRECVFFRWVPYHDCVFSVYLLHGR